MARYFIKRNEKTIVSFECKTDKEAIKRAQFLQTQEVRCGLNAAIKLFKSVMVNGFVKQKEMKL